MPKARSLRPTFLLRCVVTLVVFTMSVLALLLLGAATGVMRRLSLSEDVALGIVGLVLAIWLFLDFGEFLLAHTVTRLARSKPGPVNGLWFIDVEVEESREREKAQQAVKDNASL